MRTFLVVLLLVGCGDDSSVDDAGRDTTDAFVGSDTGDGTDAGAGLDAGRRRDAGEGIDGGNDDGGGDLDAGPGVDAPGIDAPDVDGGPLEGGDTTEPFPIDMGDAPGTPATYKGLPLRLTASSEPSVTAVDGIIGVVCIGMSNSFQECDYWIDTLTSPPRSDEIAPEVRFINCAVGGNAIERWNDPAADENLWERCINTQLPREGVRVDQVRVIYHKAANQFTSPDMMTPYPPYPDADSDYFNFYDNLGTFADRIRGFLPAVQAVYTTSRSYGGFASRPARGEPLSYEEGHALNAWLADNPVVDGIWHGWGPYIWAPDCSTSTVNGSGVCYERGDFQADGQHPAEGARMKIASMIHDRFLQHAWYRR